jgi:hypothetical protein
VSSLFPEGITQLGDLPYSIHDAITVALQYLTFEELPKDERPSRSIYLNTKALKEHFEAVEKRRDEKYGGEDKEIEDPVENDAAKLLMTK